MASFADISIRFSANLKEFSTQLENAQRDMKKFGRQLKRTGAQLTVGLTAPITALGVKSFTVFSDFEDQLAKVQAISGATASEFEALRKNAEELGASTRFTASQVGELELNLSKLGFSPAEILASTSAILDLSIATGEDLAQSATVAASTLRGFQLSAEETDRIVDVMAKSFSSSALDLNKFQTAMGVLAPVAKTAGVSIEEATGQLAVLVNAGIDASTAGTGLRNIFLDLADKGMTMSQAFAQINNSANKNATAMNLFGKRGATVATVLADNVEEANALTQEFENAGGAAKAMSKIMNDTAKGSMAALNSAIESASIAIGDTLAPYIRKLADYLSGLISKFRELEPQTKKIVVVVGALAAAIGPVMVTVGLLATNVLPGLISAFVATKAAFASLTAVMAANPFGALAAAIGLVAGAFLVLNRNSRETVRQQTVLEKVTEQATRSIAKEKAELAELLFTARDERLSKEHRVAAIRELNKLSPKYLGDLKLEKMHTDEARIAIDKYNESLLESARVKAAQEKLQDLQSQMIDMELKSSSARRELMNDQVFINQMEAKANQAGVTTQQVMNEFFDALQSGSDLRMKSLKADEEALLQIIANNKGVGKSYKSLGDEIENFGKRQKATSVSAFDDVSFESRHEGLRKQIEILKLVQAEYSKTSDEYKWLADQIDFHTETIDNAINGITFAPLTKIITKSMLQAQESIRKTKEVIEEFEDAINRAIKNSIVAFGEAFGTMISQVVDGANVGKSVSNMLFGTLGDMLITLGKIALETAAGLVAIELALESFNPYIVAAAGVALIALGRSVKNQVKATAFADGGLVYGPTLGLVGEYAGARNNPEVIAPLNKLKELLEPGAGAVIIGGELTADGNKLRVLLNRTDARNSRFGG